MEFDPANPTPPPAATPEVEFDKADDPNPFDERIERIKRARDPQPVISADPAGAVMVTEMQEIKERIDIIGSALMAGLFLLGIIAGIAVVTHYQNQEISNG